MMCGQVSLRLSSLGLTFDVAERQPGDGHVCQRNDMRLLDRMRLDQVNLDSKGRSTPSLSKYGCRKGTICFGVWFQITVLRNYYCSVILRQCLPRALT